MRAGPNAAKLAAMHRRTSFTRRSSRGAGAGAAHRSGPAFRAGDVALLLMLRNRLGPRLAGVAALATALRSQRREERRRAARRQLIRRSILAASVGVGAAAGTNRMLGAGRR